MLVWCTDLKRMDVSKTVFSVKVDKPYLSQFWRYLQLRVHPKFHHTISLVTSNPNLATDLSFYPMSTNLTTFQMRVPLRWDKNVYKWFRLFYVHFENTMEIWHLIEHNVLLAICGLVFQLFIITNLVSS